MADSELRTHRIKHFIVNCSRLEENLSMLASMQAVTYSPLVRTQSTLLASGLLLSFGMKAHYRLCCNHEAVQ
jgi:hypothetical protein